MKVALVTESLWGMGGANRVLEHFCEIYSQADIYSIFGNKKSISKKISEHSITFSILNRLPFVRKIYRYTYFLWPFVVENFNLSKYDLVISSSSCVAHGVITDLHTKHICYLHSPMRYAWDLSNLYFKKGNFSFWKRLVIPIFLNYLRIWDVIASQRPNVLISNSNFVKKRVQKYWGREVDFVLNPPVKLFKEVVKKERKNYFVAGAPFEFNKRGDFLLDRAVELKFNLKLIGTGSLFKKFRKKYNKYTNIEFLGYVSEKEKMEIFSNAKGFLMAGIEDFGIFPIEAMSCGTPILVANTGSVSEYILEGQNGLSFKYDNKESFEISMKKFNKKKWDYLKISKTVSRFNEKNFREKFEEIVKE